MKKKQSNKKIEKMKAEEVKITPLKKQAEILCESQMMTPDCQCTLEATYTDLQIVKKKSWKKLRNIRKHV